MAVTQKNREIEIIVPALGEDVLLLRKMSLNEELGRLFTLDLDILSTENIKFEDLLGQNITVRFNIAGEKQRFFNGYVGSVLQAVDEGRYARYYATVYPWLWFLTRTTDCRIFQNMSVPAIIEQLFGEFGYAYENKLSGSYRQWEYCVQYRETDFNFVSRLMEQEGIYYYFTHENGKHTLILADALGSHEPIPDYATIIYRPPSSAALYEQGCISDWSLSKQLQPCVYALNDYNFIRPSADQHVTSKVSRTHEEANHEIYDYPGEYDEKGDGSQYARTRIQELHSQYEQMNGQGSVRALLCGGLFSLTDYPREDQNDRQLLVTSVNHAIRIDDFEAGGGGGTAYSNSFTVIDSKTPFRPARITPKPIVQGPQTAVVVGPSGEEIHTDQHGRVKLQFHWDRYGKKDENSSCWVRVSQLWAGKNWGGIHIPRMGQEVIVEFLEGDPDRPIITGRVYNGEQIPPYALPANKTQSGIKSRSSKGGSGANFNEIRMEDKKGSEQLYIHAEKNQDNIVENDETTEVGHDRTEHVGHDEKITIDNNRTEKVGVNEDITIGSNRTEKVGVNEDITIGSNRTEKVGVNETITIGANRTKSVGASETVSVALQRTHKVGINETIGVGAAQEVGIGAYQTVNVGAYQSINVGADQSTDVGANQSTNVTADQSLSVGGNQSESVSGNASKKVDGDDALKVGKTLVIDVADSITIKTGDASITMKKNGDIQIKGNNISIKGSGKISVKADGDMVLKGSKIGEN